MGYPGMFLLLLVVCSRALLPAASLVPEEEPLLEREGSGAVGTSAPRSSPADFVPPPETLRAWHGIVDDAAASVRQQALPTYGVDRLRDGFEVSGVRVST